MAGTLENLLRRVRDGSASPAEVEQARALVAHDARLPEELRVDMLVDDPEGDAAGLLAVLGADDLFADALRDAIAHEISAEPQVALAELEEPDAGWDAVAVALREGLALEAVGVEVADRVMRRLPGQDFVYGSVTAEAVAREAGAVEVSQDVVARMSATVALDVAEAVRVEAGSTDVVEAVCAELQIAVEPLVAAVQREAGSVDVAHAVCAELELAGVPLAASVRSEAGSVEVAALVAAQLGEPAAAPLVAAIAAEAGAVDVVDAVLGDLGIAGQRLPPSVVEPPRVPRPANRAWWGRGALAAAAVALFALGTQLLPGSPEPVQFASASEVVVEDLDYADNVQVFQAEGDEGAVILWVDEEAVL